MFRTREKWDINGFIPGDLDEVQSGLVLLLKRTLESS